MAEQKPNPDTELKTESIESVGHTEKIQRLVNDNPNILQVTNICFKESDSQISQPKPTVRIMDETPIADIVRDIICNEWTLNNPQIVVFIVSNVGPVHNWTNVKQIKSFQKGLMKAVENTNMWLITNGLDVGATSIIGDAVTNHITEAKYKRQTSADKTYAKFNFIGIVDQKLLKYLDKITESNQLKTVIDMTAVKAMKSDSVSSHSSPATVTEKYELEQNLSHYVLVKDKTVNKMGVNIFLENLIEYLSSIQSGTRDGEPKKSRKAFSSKLTPESKMEFDRSSRAMSEIGDKDKSDPNAKLREKEIQKLRAENLFKYLQENEVPIVSIVIKGGYGVSKLVKSQVEKRIPVVVLRGSGGLADLLSFVDVEIRNRRTDLWNVEFVESYLKPELTIKIMESFPNLRNNSLVLNQFRQRILDIVRLSKDTKTRQNYLTIINMLDLYSVDLENLTEHLLFALFRSQRAELEEDAQPEKPEQRSNPLIIKDLALCIDWNCPEMAKKEVLAKNPKFDLNSPVVWLLFEKTLIRENRWKIVDLFLSQKFKLRSYVPSRLKKIFRQIHLNKFFVNVCWEGILGRNKSSIPWFFNQDEIDLERRQEFQTNYPNLNPRTSSWCQDFNWLIEACTGITDFLDEIEIEDFRIDSYERECLSEREAERKCLELLVFWALFDYRRELVHILWKHSDQPIHLAIIIALAYQHLSWYVTEETLSNRLKEESGLFVSFACELLDQIYRNDSYRAEEVLNESVRSWKFKTSVDMAAIGKFRAFFSHESVQRWLTLQTYGNIEIKDMRYGLFRMPIMLKLILSAYLVFPGYFWVRIANEEEDIQSEKWVLFDTPSEEDLMEKIAEQPTKSEKSSESLTRKPQMRTDDTRKRLIEPIKRVANHIHRPRRQSPMKGESTTPITTMIYEIWTAPITKFWNFQFFYTFYLSIFSIAVLFPSCGMKSIDTIVCVWTTLLILDSIRQNYMMYQKQTKIQAFRIVQIAFQMAFVSFFSYNRVFNEPRTVNEAYYVKVFMCLALLHAYMVLLIVFLPISPTLGPLLYRLRIMIYVDFLNFIRLSILVMISFGIVLQALFYPDMKIGGEVALQAFHRAFFSMFRAFTNDLEWDETCDQYKKIHKSQMIFDQPGVNCSASVYTKDSCRNVGFWPYFLMVLYYILLKNILMTLLMAIFALSAARLTADTDRIWKFQRYGLVMDFVTRAPLPPPLNIFYYIYWILRFICAFLTDCFCSEKKDNFKIIRHVKQIYYGPERQPKLLADDDYTYLRILASEVYDKYEKKLRAESLAFQQFDRTKANSEELENHRRSLRQLNSKMCEIERSVRQSYASLEAIRHLVDKKFGLETTARMNLHILSRHSPYPHTNVQRYPLPDKYVSWDVMFIEYDPVAYTKAMDEFSPDIQQLVDSDILAAKTQELSGQSIKESKFEWNRISGAVVAIDRRSWEESDGEPLIYKLDNGIPVNPLGRTGLRGRGALLRWGPNHYNMLVITRLIEHSGRRHTLEVLVEKIDVKGQRKEKSLINRFIGGEVTYESFESLFNITESDLKRWTTSEKMIAFFKSFDDIKESKTSSRNSMNSMNENIPNLRFERLMRGYFDDPLNTDQAWKEVELWHFHFNNQRRVLDGQISSHLEWNEVNESLFSELMLSQSQVIQMVVNKLDVAIR